MISTLAFIQQLNYKGPVPVEKNIVLFDVRICSAIKAHANLDAIIPVISLSNEIQYKQ